jgi:hypothetical protein
LNEKGYIVERSSLKDFNPVEVLDIHYDRIKNGKITRIGGLGSNPPPSRKDMKKQFWKYQLDIPEYEALLH